MKIKEGEQKMEEQGVMNIVELNKVTAKTLEAVHTHTHTHFMFTK